MGLWDFLFGSTEPAKQIPIKRFEPWQEEMMKRLGTQGGTGLEQLLGGDLGQGGLESEAMRQYQQQIIPQLLERMTAGVPTAGTQRSSALGQQLGAAGGDLATRLASLRNQVAMQRAGILGNLLGVGTQPMFETMYQPEQQRPGLFQALMPAVGAGLGGLGMGLGTSLAGSLMGSGLGTTQQPNISGYMRSASPSWMYNATQRFNDPLASGYASFMKPNQNLYF